MAESTYHLYIHAEDFAGSKSAVAGQNGGAGTSSKPQGNKGAEGASKALMGLVSYSSIAATADKLIGYEVSQVELRTGAREYEQKLQFGYSMAKKGVGIGAAVVGGIATGNLPAVAIGLVAAGINSVIKISQNANTLRTQESLENISIGMANVRAGTAGRRSPNQ